MERRFENLITAPVQTKIARRMTKVSRDEAEEAGNCIALRWVEDILRGLSQATIDANDTFHTAMKAWVQARSLACSKKNLLSGICRQIRPSSCKRGAGLLLLVHHVQGLVGKSSERLVRSW